MSEPIVVAVAETEEAPAAVELGVRMARLLGAPLVLGSVALCPAPVNGSVVPGWAPEPRDPGPRCERARRRTERLLAGVPGDVACSVHVVAAPNVVTGLQEIVEREAACLLVLGASHVGAVTHAFASDVVLGAMRHAGCSVLLAPATARRPAVTPAPQAIGVAWDRSPEAADALAVAVDLAARTGAVLRLVHVLEPVAPIATPYLDPLNSGELLAARHEQAEAEVAEAAAGTRSTVATQTLVRESHAVDALVAASADLDLLVIGSRRHGPLRRVAFGSTSAGLAHRARCPVLVVPRGARVPSPAV
jgi:nucleotide-binding universal stress UspA family protein